MRYRTLTEPVMEKAREDLRRSESIHGPRTKAAATIRPGDLIALEGQPEVLILRGPWRSEKWSPGRVHFEAEAEDGRVYKVALADTDRVEVR